MHINSPSARRRRIQLVGRDVVTHGLKRSAMANAYHALLTLSWPAFFGMTAALFLIFDALFAGLYMLGDAPIANQYPAGFWGAFFFSVETLATVGYGDMHPVTLYGHILATIEIFVGMISIALVTGIVFARFSRPRAMIMFARHPVVHDYDGKPTLIIRIANARQNVIQEASARLRVIRQETSLEGHSLRRLHDLKLVRDQQPLFMLGWNLMHVIDETSPLAGLSPSALADLGAGLILTIEGVDETTSQLMQARQTYDADTIRWQAQYRDMFYVDDAGVSHMDFAHFHTVEAITPALQTTAP